MPEFRPPSYGPMDREYHERLEFDTVKGSSDIEAPILTVGEIGQTIPEVDQSGRFKTFIQQAQAAIRAGAGKLQLAMMVPHTSPMGGRFKAYGKEIRTALREVALASQVEVSGVELPTSSLTNMSGYDPQRNRFSDEVRQDHIDEVKDAIRFTAEALGGGGVDIVSWEYERPINDAGWNKKDEKLKEQLFRQSGEMEVIQVVDTEDGRVVALQKKTVLHLPYEVPKVVTGEDKDLDVEYDTVKKLWIVKSTPEKEFTKEGAPYLVDWNWDKFRDTAEKIKEAARNHNAKPGIKEENKWPEQVEPETLLIQMQFEGQKKSAEGYAGIHGSEAKEHKKSADAAKNAIEKCSNIQEIDKRSEIIKQEFMGAEIELRQEIIQQFAENNEQLKLFQEKEQLRYAHAKSLAEGQAQQVKEIEERQKRFTAVSSYAVNNAIKSYAEAGITAMQETHNKNSFAKRPVHVGPEIGWPQFYGSHPDEFVDLIRKSRVEMSNKLVKESGYDKADADEQAKIHIKGVFDTSHLGMWLKNFRQDLPWEKRVDEFNKWFTKQVEKIAEINKKEDIIGAIQAVDTITGAHAHLPPGQGILPVVQAVKILKEKGDFKGFIVSEGHEEEKFGENRILTKAWEKFGAHLENSGYRPGSGAPLTWNAVQNSYFGKTYSPMFMFGSYAPSNDFKLWSEIPLE